MFNKIFPAIAIVITLASCSSMKPVNNTYKRPVSNQQQVTKQNATAQADREVKFLEEISVESGTTNVNTPNYATIKTASGKQSGPSNSYLNRTSSVEKASDLHLKYAILLNTEVELIQDNQLLEYVDEWYGTRYKYGGTTKKGIDCSAFVQAIYLSAFAVSLPRTAREQYRSSRIVSATEVKCGDLVFFNTTGGISHVGIYLQNNKFVHASTSQGVTISDMFDPYYLKRFIGIGRIEKAAAAHVRK